MSKHLRVLFAALAVVSMFTLPSCRSNRDCFEPCSTVSCAPACDPCPPSCQPTRPYGFDVQNGSQSKTGPMIQKVSYQGSGYYPQPQPCKTEPNPYCPCNPEAFPCGNGKACGATPFQPDQACYRNMRSYQTCDDCIVDLYQRAPEFATVGSPYPIEIVVTARKECVDVSILQTLPCGAEFVRADPNVTPGPDGKLSWDFPHLAQGESQRIVVWVKPTREGCCLSEATVCACPQLCAYTNCGQPVVCIKKYGPACACIYCPVSYCIEVCNSGSAPAYDVIVQDNVPDGLTHASGYNCLTYQLGTLCPGDSRKINVDFCANKRGCVTNTATVSYCGGPKCTAEASTLINQPCVEITKTGPDWAYICKIVDYTITVTNPGDLVLRDVYVEDISPAGTTIVEAPGAQVCCNKATWCFSELCPGETKTLTVSVRSQVAGCLVNKVTVTSQSDCGPCTMCAEAPTCWKGIAATHMCMVDTVDPICVGDSTIYRICVNNRGTADDTNIRLSVRFTDELQPQSVNGPTQGSISGQTVTFAPLERMSPKGCVEYTICVKGVSPGDAKAEATLSSDALTTPVVDQESTHVY